MNKNLEVLCTVSESIRIKSGAWDENGVFLYSTLNHIKYCLPNGCVCVGRECLLCCLSLTVFPRLQRLWHCAHA